MWFERNVMYSVCIRFECSGRVTDGFQKKKLDRDLSSIQFFWDFWNCFNFAKPLSRLWRPGCSDNRQTTVGKEIWKRVSGVLCDRQITVSG